MFKEFNQFWETWQSIKFDQKIPKRCNFKPEKVANLLGDISIYEWQEPNVLYMRLVGMHLASLMGVDTTGYNYMEWVSEEVGEFFKKEWRKIFNNPCALTGIFQNRNKSGRIIENSFMALPLSVEGLENNQMLILEKNIEIKDLVYDSKSPEIITLGIKDIEIINLGYGLPDIDLEYYKESIIYTG